MQAVLKSVKVLLLNICNTLELSGSFVCLGGIDKFFIAWRGGEVEKIAGFWFDRRYRYPGWHYLIQWTKFFSGSTYFYKIHVFDETFLLNISSQILECLWSGWRHAERSFMTSQRSVYVGSCDKQNTYLHLQKMC